MKLFYFIFLFAPLIIQSQEVFYKDYRGEVYDSITYAKMHEMAMQDYKEGYVKEGFEEVLTLFSSKNKKKIYSYQWVKRSKNMMFILHNHFKRGKFQGNILPLPKERTTKGKVINKKSLKEKPTLINFWFIGCKPCVAEMPSLNKIVEKYKDKVNFVSVTYESDENINNFTARKPFDFMHIGLAKEYIELLEITSFPMNLFLDRKGVLREVRKVMMGIAEGSELTEDGDTSEFEAILDSLLAEQN